MPVGSLHRGLRHVDRAGSGRSIGVGSDAGARRRGIKGRSKTSKSQPERAVDR